MIAKAQDPIFDYFSHEKSQKVEPAFLNNSGVLRGYKVSFPTWSFIYLFEPAETMSIVEFSSQHSMGVQATTASFVRVLKALLREVPQIKVITGALLEPSDPIERKRAEKLRTIFERLGARVEPDEGGYPCLTYRIDAEGKWA